MSYFYQFLCCFFVAIGALFGEETFTVGTTSGYAPYVSLNSRGEYEGFDIDLAKLISEKLGKKLVIKDLGSMPSLMLGLKQKKVDALIWAISITEERQKQMEMVYYQGEKITEMPLVFWGKIPENVKGPQDIDPKKSVCVEAGSYQEQVLKSFSGINLKNVDKISDALLEIKFGKSIAIAVDNSLVSFVKEQSPELRVLYFPLERGQQSLGNGICIDKSNPALAGKIQKAVDELTQEGKIRELEEKWKMGT
ncbi:MAG: transporter substrate-binding domain-containing protein [Verrucomicrobia bacterium]|nr:transporter substrate-binding domain-containing protein [Verrucomicrobiota bacterium]